MSELVALLTATLAAQYPTRVADMSRPGRVSCAVVPVDCDYEDAVCAPSPLVLTCEVHIMAAGSDAQSVKDLLVHVDAVASLARTAGFAPSNWRASSRNDMPEIVLEAVADGKG